jgi:hypothetical protein
MSAESPNESVHTVQSSELSRGIVGLFEAPEAANQALELLLSLGHEPSEIGILISETTKRRLIGPSLLKHPVELTDEAAQAQEESENPASATMLQGAGVVSAVGVLSGILVGARAPGGAPRQGVGVLGARAPQGAGVGAHNGGV